MSRSLSAVLSIASAVVVACRGADRTAPRSEPPAAPVAAAQPPAPAPAASAPSAIAAPTGSTAGPPIPVINDAFEDLPVYGSSDLTQITAPEIIAAFDDPRVSDAERLNTLLSYHSWLIALSQRYLQDCARHREFLVVIAANLDMAAREAVLIERILPTLAPDDPSYAKRVAGRETFRRNAIATIGALGPLLTSSTCRPQSRASASASAQQSPSCARPSRLDPSTPRSPSSTLPTTTPIAARSGWPSPARWNNPEHRAATRHRSAAAWQRTVGLVYSAIDAHMSPLTS